MFLLFEKYVFPVGADGYSQYGDTGGFFHCFEIVEEVFGQFAVFGDTLQALFPSGEGLELGLDFHFVELEGDFIGVLTVDVVVHAHLYFVEVVHDIGFGDEEMCYPVEHACVAQGRDVNPSAAAWASGGGSVFVAYFAETCAGAVEELGGEGAGTDACAVGFADAHYTAYARGSHSQSGAYSGSYGAG